MFDKERLEAVDLENGVPQDEPERQYYFMKMCRAWMEREKERLGRDLTVSVQTLGCQMNAKDSEKMTAILTYIGYKETEEPVADLVLYNTCTVRENANLKIYGRLGYLKNHKKKNPDMKIVLCGCMMQEADEVEKVRKSYPFVDVVFGTHNIYKLAELLYTQIESERQIMDVWEEAKEIVEDLPGKRKYPFKTGVNIMFGCNNFCSYCIVPYVRGRERSREPEDILDEIRGLVADGVVEIMLLGQNVNSYGKNLEHPVSFAELLRRVNAIEGLRRIRFMTSHPKDLSDELIEAMADCEKVCAHLHLPLQSGSSRILKKMNRHYTKESYLALVERIREKLPDISLTTDIIVGFPGETEEDFEETLDVVKKVRYDSAYTFIYSKRSGTPAAAMEDQVPEDVVKQRFDRLLAAIKEISSQITASRVGQAVDVLFEEVNEQDATLLTGRLSNNDVVHCKADPSLIGTIASVKLTESRGFYYMGELSNTKIAEKAPFILERADPFVIRAEDGTYYFTASYPMTSEDDKEGYDRVILRRGKTLDELKDAEEITIWKADDTTQSHRFIWAPELHKIGGIWYVMYAGSRLVDDRWDIACHMLRCEGEDPYTGTWTEVGPCERLPEDDFSFRRFSLDMTYFENGDRSYVIWAQHNDEPVSCLYLAEVDRKEPWKLISMPMLLTHPDYEWEKIRFAVNEGPAVIKRGDDIVVFFSASGTGPEYCVGMISADKNSDLLDPQSWNKYEKPVLTSEDLIDEYGPGHNSFTVDESGQDVIVYHARSKECFEGKCGYTCDDPLYDPCRHARLRVMKWNEQGIPEFM